MNSFVCKKDIKTVSGENIFTKNHKYFVYRTDSNFGANYVFIGIENRDSGEWFSLNEKEYLTHKKVYDYFYTDKELLNKKIKKVKNA